MNGTYSYQNMKQQLFTEEGTKLLLKIRSNVDSMTEVSGAVAAYRAWKGCAGSTWLMSAALDFLCELGEIHCLNSDSWGQFRVYVKPREDG